MISPVNSPIINYRKDAKKGIKLTIMVCGESGTGKSTFVNSLLDKRVMYHKFEDVPEETDTKTLTFTGVTSTLPQHSFSQKAFDAYRAGSEPGIALTETNVEVIDEERNKLYVTIIDTPGFGDNLNNEVCFVEIENYLKQQFDMVLAEETKIRRNPRFSDSRVHVLLYFIAPTGHGLREIDVTCMKRLARYVNIIPVISKADSFTELELRHFKKNVMEDIEKYNVPIFQFSYDEDDDDEELIEESKFLQRIQPFSIISSEDEFQVNGQIIKGRQYPWGFIDINNPKYSDFPILKSVLLGSHLQDLKDLTHDFLYETYRTQRLKSVAGDKFDEDMTQDTNTTVGGPSLSNLAQLANSDSMMYEAIQAKPLQSETTLSHGSQTVPKTKKSMLLDENDDDDDQSSIVHKTRSLLLDDNASTTSTSYSTPRIKQEEGAFSEVSSLGTPRKKPPHSPSQSSPSSSSSIAFKRYSIAPQRNQLRVLSETVPYVLRHERISEKQQKLEEMEASSARELSLRASLLEKRAAELKMKEKQLMREVERRRLVKEESAEPTIPKEEVNEDFIDAKGEQE